MQDEQGDFKKPPNETLKKIERDQTDLPVTFKMGQSDFFTTSW